jgi:subtilisin-like proprotein convertase family protein
MDLRASFSVTLEQGAYYLAIDGDGNASEVDNGYSDYGSLGFYTITGVRQPDDPGTVAGRVWDDVNRDGLQDLDESGLAGRTVYRDDNGNGLFDSSVETASSSDVPQAIPDIASFTSEVVVTGYASITDLNVTLDITHTWASDLIVTLISPSQTRVELFNKVGGGNDHFRGTTLDDEAATPIGSGGAPFSGVFRPSELLSAFDGEDANGVWTLEVIDSRFDDTGVLNSWSLTVASQEQAAATDPDGNFVFPEVRPGDYQFGLVPQSGWSQSFPAEEGFHAVSVESRQDVTGINFGSHRTPAPLPSVADFNGDSAVDGTDFLVWQRGLGSVGSQLRSSGDADNNGKVDGDDLSIWQDGFGGAEQGEQSAAASTAAGDLVALAAASELQRASTSLSAFGNDAGVTRPGQRYVDLALEQYNRPSANGSALWLPSGRRLSDDPAASDAVQSQALSADEAANNLAAWDDALGMADAI